MRAPLHAALFLLGALICLPTGGSAQERPQSQRPDTARAHASTQGMEHQQDAEEMQEMQQQIRAMLPMMSATLHNLTQGTMQALAEPETAQNLAKFVRNYYQALIAQGFSREEALRIVSNVGLPGIPGM